MYRLQVMHYICQGARTCGACEEHLEGFLTKHCGELLISKSNLTKNIEAITEALNSCPTESLVLEEVV